MVTAVDMGVFDRLHGRAITLSGFTQVFGLRERPARILLTALTAMGLLVKTGPSYRNSPLAEAYLVRTSPLYYGGYLRKFDEETYENFRSLDRALRQDAPVVPVEGDVFRAIQRDPVRMRRFYAAMHANAIVWARELAGRYDFSRHRRLLDIGGGQGTYSIEVCRKYRALRSVVFDLPPVLSITRRRIREARLSHRIEAMAGDFFTEPLPHGADVALLSAILHDWPPDKITAILGRVHDALPRGGTLLVRELFVNDDGTGPLYAAMSSLVMLLEVHGENYSWATYEGWLREAGFGRFRRIRFPTTAAAGVLVARRL